MWALVVQLGPMPNLVGAIAIPSGVSLMGRQNCLLGLPHSLLRSKNCLLGRVGNWSLRSAESRGLWAASSAKAGANLGDSLYFSLHQGI
jgi:hypothetical protein